MSCRDSFNPFDQFLKHLIIPRLFLLPIFSHSAQRQADADRHRVLHGVGRDRPQRAARAPVRRRREQQERCCERFKLRQGRQQQRRRGQGGGVQDPEGRRRQADGDCWQRQAAYEGKMV